MKTAITILGRPVKWADVMPSCNCTDLPIVFGSLLPPDRFVDAETPDGRKFKIRVRYVATRGADGEDE